MKDIKKIGIITSGGDCGGLNAVVKGAALTALSLGIEPFIIPNGYAGLYNIGENPPVEINHSRIDKIIARFAGSEAGHSRVKISKIDDPQKYNRIKEGLVKHNIDALIIAGGDDTGSVVVDLVNNGISCVHCPKTMDLDLQTYSVGGDSTINRIAKYTNELRTTGMTHNRVIIVEVFGRYAGHTALRGGLGADADCILIPEINVDFDEVYTHLKENYSRRLKNSDVKAVTYMIVAAEGIKNKDGEYFTDSASNKDSFGHVRLTGCGQYIHSELEKRMKADKEWKEIFGNAGMFVQGIYEHPEIREVQLGHLVRAGESSAYDVTFGKRIGGAAVHLLASGNDGVTVANIDGDNIQYVDIKKAIEQRFVDTEELAFYEGLGVCFGRKQLDYQPKFKKLENKIERYM